MTGSRRPLEAPSHSLRFSWLYALLSMALVACVVFAAVMNWRVGGAVARDVEGVEPQRAVAVVVSTTPPGHGTHGTYSSGSATVRWGDHTASGETDATLAPGQSVLVTYRVGHSGRVYVDRVAPL